MARYGVGEISRPNGRWLFLLPKTVKAACGGCRAAQRDQKLTRMVAGVRVSALGYAAHLQLLETDPKVLYAAS